MWPDESRFIFLNQGIGVRGETDEMIHPTCLLSTVATCGGSARICGCCSCSCQSSATLWVNWLPEYTEWSSYSINKLFLCWWRSDIPRCLDSLGSNRKTVVQGSADVIFLHPVENLWNVLLKAFPQWTDFPFIHSRSMSWLCHVKWVSVSTDL